MPNSTQPCPSCADAQRRVEELRDVLERVWAAIGDRLLAKGPLDNAYANAVANEVKRALADQIEGGTIS